MAARKPVSVVKKAKKSSASVPAPSPSPAPTAEFDTSVDTGVDIPSGGFMRASKYRDLAESFATGDSKLMLSKSNASLLCNHLRKLGHGCAVRPEGDGFRVWATPKREKKSE